MVEINENLLSKLINLHAVSGFEYGASSKIKEIALEFCHESWIDNVGNCVLKVEGKTDTIVVIEAHIDEIGFIISGITPDGLLEFIPVGFFDDRTLLGKRIIIANPEGEEIMGVFVSLGETEEEPVHRKNMRIQVGAKNREDVEAMGIGEGCVATYYGPLEKMGNSYVGKAFDLRLGCYVILEVLKRLKKTPGPYQVFGLLTTQEEIGRKGVRGIIRKLKPSLAIITEIVPARTCGYKKEDLPLSCGEGPVLTLSQATNDTTDPDGGFICNPALASFIKSVAKKERIPLQLDVYATDCSTFVTNAGVVYTLNGGIETCLISVPYKYMHTSTEFCYSDDLKNTILLIEALLRNEQLVSKYEERTKF